MKDQVFGVHCSNGFREFDSHTTTINTNKIRLVLDNINVKQIKNITMFKVKEKDLFEKNMNNYELHQTWVKMKEKQEADKWFDELEKKYNEEKQDKYY